MRTRSTKYWCTRTSPEISGWNVHASSFPCPPHPSRAPMPPPSPSGHQCPGEQLRHHLRPQPETPRTARRPPRHARCRAPSSRAPTSARITRAARGRGIGCAAGAGGAHSVLCSSAPCCRDAATIRPLEIGILACCRSTGLPLCCTIVFVSGPACDVPEKCEQESHNMRRYLNLVVKMFSERGFFSISRTASRKICTL